MAVGVPAIGVSRCLRCQINYKKNMYFVVRYIMKRFFFFDVTLSLILFQKTNRKNEL